MTTPVLHLLAGPNGSGKSTFYEQILEPATGLLVINADQIAAARWPGSEVERGYDAAGEAAAQRARLLDERTSFATESVFSHPSKVDLLRAAKSVGYQIALHVCMIPVELAVARVTLRVEAGGHAVPEPKIRARYERLWDQVVEAVRIADSSIVYDNSAAEFPYRVVARFDHGKPVGVASWPAWAPEQLRAI